jgi:EAL domain-containing protein (putative c-di-GMP-specific phosphodiesterase class I)
MEEKILLLFQPIKDCWKDITIGYEATTKGEMDGQLYSFEDFYRMALERGFDGSKLDRISRDKSIREFLSKSTGNERVFLNLSPLSINDAWFMEDVYQDMGKVVLEITENNKFIITPRIVERLKNLKDKGMKIALDDFGKDYSNFKLVSELEPDIIKLDKYFVENLESAHSKNIIKGMVDFTKQTKIDLIVEGIETEEQKEILLELGVRYMQGYFLGMPEPLETYFR